MDPLNRRDFISVSAAAAGSLMTPSAGFAAEAGVLVAPSGLRIGDRNWSKIRGFNYAPSYGSNGFELWQNFNAKIIEVELARGKKYFPGMNALRWWHSWDAFLRNPTRYLKNFETTLQLADKVGCTVMPVLFNRWRDVALDFGGIFIDHFYPSIGRWKDVFQHYVKAIVGAHRDDPRILAWDLCNEPALTVKNKKDAIADAEWKWLEAVHGMCREAGAKAPLTVGIPPWVTLDQVDSISDVLSIHPYWAPGLKDQDPLGTFAVMYQAAEYEKSLDAGIAFSRKVGKPLIASECCWGHLQDETRVALASYTLSKLEHRGIGWTVHLLHHSLVADAHRPEFGPVTPENGNFAFIEADGSLRRGHEFFNKY